MAPTLTYSTLKIYFMNNKSLNRSVGTLLIAVVIPIITVVSQAQEAKADWWSDFVTPNLDRARSETVGRAFKQTYVGSLYGNQISQLQASQGSDWHSSVTNWCNNLVGSQANYSVPYLNSTWRIENGTANCYFRQFWYK